MVCHSIIGKNITMRNSLISLFIFLLLSCSSGYQFKTEDEKSIKLDYDFYLLEDGLVQFDVDYFIPYSKLIFNKKKNGFSSDITLSITVAEENKQIFYNDSWSENIYVDYFEETKSRDDYIGHFTFIIERTEESLIQLSINDYANHKYYKYEQNLIIDDYQYLSDIKLYIKDNEKYFNIDNLDNSKLEKLDTLWIKYQIIDDDIGDNSIVFEIVNKNINNDKILKYNVDSSDLISHTIGFYPLSLGEMTYKNLIINCYYKDIHKFKSIRIDEEEEIEIDYTILFNPMEKYMFNRTEYIQYADLDSFQRVAYIEDYWLEKDNPNLFIEFYKRVRYSNVNFKKIGFKGSDSDQGRIYIIHGRPQNIDYEFNENGEFEIWQYRNKKFIFINRFGYYECYQC